MASHRFLLVFLCLFPGVVLASANALQDASKLLRQGQRDQALVKVNGHLADHPKDAQGRFLKGLILAEMNRTPEAIKVFSDLTDDYPELPEPYNNLAVLYAAQGQYERAKQSLEMAIRTHPSYATAHENLGDIYAKMASAAYDKALQLDKSNLSAQTKLALIKEIFNPASIEKEGPPVAAGDKASTAAKSTSATATPAPAAKIAEAKKPAAAQNNPGEPSAATSKAEIEKTLNDWAAAWSSKDVAAYLAFYAADFAPPDTERAEWEEQRRERISAAEHIRVRVSQLKIRLEGRKARVSFRQDYVSDRHKDVVRKIMRLENQGGAWKIVSER